MRQIQWTKDDVELNLESDRYSFGSLDDIFLKIKSPTEKDIGRYICTVTDDTGSTQQYVTLGIINRYFIQFINEFLLIILQIISGMLMLLNSRSFNINRFINVYSLIKRLLFENEFKLFLLRFALCKYYN